MKRRAKVDPKEVKVAFEVVAGRQGGEAFLRSKMRRRKSRGARN